MKLCFLQKKLSRSFNNKHILFLWRIFLGLFFFLLFKGTLVIFIIMQEQVEGNIKTQGA